MNTRTDSVAIKMAARRRNNNNNNNNSTIQMMRLFQENVKKDISATDNIIKFVQQKLRDCDKDLMMMRKITSELNCDFKSIETKINTLDESMRNRNSPTSSIAATTQTHSPNYQTVYSDNDTSNYKSSISRHSSVSSMTDTDDYSTDSGAHSLAEPSTHSIKEDAFNRYLIESKIRHAMDHANENTYVKSNGSLVTDWSKLSFSESESVCSSSSLSSTGE